MLYLPDIFINMAWSAKNIFLPRAFVIFFFGGGDANAVSFNHEGELTPPLVDVFVYRKD